MVAAVAGNLGGAAAASGERISKVELDNLRGTGIPLLAAICADRRIVWPVHCGVFCSCSSSYSIRFLRIFTKLVSWSNVVSLM